MASGSDATPVPQRALSASAADAAQDGAVSELNALLALHALQGVGRVSLHPQTSADLDFSADVYALTRADELAQVNWPDDAKRAFCRQQFDAQHAHYLQHYPRANLLLIVEDGERIGRLYFEQTSSELRLMEITLITAARNRGIGGTISELLRQRAHGAGIAMGLHVEPFNPARRLYERQGFVEVETRGIYLFMRCEPPGATTTATAAT